MALFIFQKHKLYVRDLSLRAQNGRKKVQVPIKPKDLHRCFDAFLNFDCSGITLHSVMTWEVPSEKFNFKTFQNDDLKSSIQFLMTRYRAYYDDLGHNQSQSKLMQTYSKS